MNTPLTFLLLIFLNLIPQILAATCQDAPFGTCSIILADCPTGPCILDAGESDGICSISTPPGATCVIGTTNPADECVDPGASCDPIVAPIVTPGICTSTGIVCDFAASPLACADCVETQCGDKLPCEKGKTTCSVGTCEPVPPPAGPAFGLCTDDSVCQIPGAACPGIFPCNPTFCTGSTIACEVGGGTPCAAGTCDRSTIPVPGLCTDNSVCDTTGAPCVDLTPCVATECGDASPCEDSLTVCAIGSCARVGLVVPDPGICENFDYCDVGSAPCADTSTCTPTQCVLSGVPCLFGGIECPSDTCKAVGAISGFCADRTTCDKPGPLCPGNVPCFTEPTPQFGTCGDGENCIINGPACADTTTCSNFICLDGTPGPICTKGILGVCDDNAQCIIDITACSDGSTCVEFSGGSGGEATLGICNDNTFCIQGGQPCGDNSACSDIDLNRPDITIILPPTNDPKQVGTGGSQGTAPIVINIPPQNNPPPASPPQNRPPPVNPPANPPVVFTPLVTRPLSVPSGALTGSVRAASVTPTRTGSITGSLTGSWSGSRVTAASTRRANSTASATDTSEGSQSTPPFNWENMAFGLCLIVGMLFV